MKFKLKIKIVPFFKEFWPRPEEGISFLGCFLQDGLGRFFVLFGCDRFRLDFFGGFDFGNFVLGLLFDLLSGQLDDRMVFIRLNLKCTYF